MDFIERLQHLSTRSVDRRQFGVLGAAALAAFAAPDVAPAARRRNQKKRKQKKQAGAAAALACSSKAGVRCPRGTTCQDEAGAFCNPLNREANCSGTCVPVSEAGPGNPTNPCAAMLCVEGTTCCPNCGGICVPTGTICSDDLCTGEVCGSRTCPNGQFCCNAACGICSPNPNRCPMIGCVAP